MGISAPRVSKISPLALIPDPTICVSDVFMTLALDLTAPELEMAVANAPRAECNRVISVPSGGLAAFLVEHSGRVLASTRIALDLLADH